MISLFCQILVSQVSQSLERLLGQGSSCDISVTLSQILVSQVSQKTGCDIKKTPCDIRNPSSVTD